MGFENFPQPPALKRGKNGIGLAMDSGFLLAVSQVGDGTFQRDSVSFTGHLSIQEHPDKIDPGASRICCF